MVQFLWSDFEMALQRLIRILLNDLVIINLEITLFHLKSRLSKPVVVPRIACKEWMSLPALLWLL